MTTVINKGSSSKDIFFFTEVQADPDSRKYFPVTVACILFSHLNAIGLLKYFLNYATPQNILFHIPELKDTSLF